MRQMVRISGLGKLTLAAAALFFCGLVWWPQSAQAGGGGQNMVLLVNPNDESALRMANAYVAARAIPERNVIFIAPPQAGGSVQRTTIHATEFQTLYANFLPQEIRRRGIEGQIDYIGTLGQPIGVRYSSPNNFWDLGGVGFTTLLGQLTELEKGMPVNYANYRYNDLQPFDTPYYPHGITDWPVSPLPYTKGDNTAIHHSTLYDKNPLNVTRTFGTGAPAITYTSPAQVQRYMAGNVGYSGLNAITTQQWIASYARSANADGTKPAGKIYFMENNDVRSNTRESYWDSVQKYMRENGIAYTEEKGTYPKDKPDLVGAIVGDGGNYANPFGSSVFLPGSYGDNMTSNGALYGANAQTKADRFIRAGAAGTAGTVGEPYADPNRFTKPSLYVFHHEGSTLGEAFYKSVSVPDLLMFQGDMLSQAYADVPRVTLTSAPANGAVVSGRIAVGASASLANPSIATGIAKMVLYVDGLERGVINADNGTFDLDTTALSDGRHEVRIVAVNNAKAESQGYTLQHITVNNKGQGIAAGASEYAATWNQMLSIPVTAARGSGTAISRIELRSLGRKVGELTGAAGNVSVDARKLAFGANQLTPVAILSDGTEVVGAPITVSRDFNRLPGKTPTAAQNRRPGLDLEYFAGKAGNTIALTNYSGTPNHLIHASVLDINPNGLDPRNVAPENVPAEYRTNAALAKLAIRASANFMISSEGEYSFHFDPYGDTFDSLRILIDGVTIYDQQFWNGSTFNDGRIHWGSDTLGTAYLLPGEHSFQLLIANTNADAISGTALLMRWRGPDGESPMMDSTSFYTSVPEPAAGLVIGCLAVALLRRRRAVMR